MKKLLTALLLALPALAHAETYRVDLIVFVDKYAPSEAGRRQFAPITANALPLDNPGALRAAGITLLNDDAFGLNDQWQRLKNARRYQPLTRLAWVQRDPPSGRATPLHLRWGDGFSASTEEGSALIAPVDGVISLSGGQLLHLDADLVYSQPTETGILNWRLDERRKMRLNELHHFDSARIGLLARIVRVGDKP